MYDIIGDVHGEADKLHKLLTLLDYRPGGTGYYHPQRKAIFLGDFINKGGASKEALEIVRSMLAREAAYAVAGNHELYLIGFFHKHAHGEYIREHTEKNTSQHAPTFSSFGQDREALLDYISWMQTLPLYLELPGIRIVHAYWHQHSIDFIKQHYPQACLDDETLAAMVPGSEVSQAVEELLVGLKLPLPPSASDSPSFKTKWWRIGKTHEYSELAIRPDSTLGNPPISYESIHTEDYHYPEKDIPLFFGHYNLPGKPRILAHNYTCLDFNLEDEPLLVAYRWDGEARLESDKLVYV
ncbi:metallophosphoesterase [Catalinimonas sp. 4WD22]|uniref:metallophosphoesterase n=1 Tax=Catalinimonas locisalis TaxID=3133978 RepID=UPI00310199CF